MAHTKDTPSFDKRTLKPRADDEKSLLLIPLDMVAGMVTAVFSPVVTKIFGPPPADMTERSWTGHWVGAVSAIAAVALVCYTIARAVG